mmetsp:Transcript_30997/g.73702  ORF Transcript_30997/g.73702 Transcript_30997/m.73702 type:complete len:251 (-) Transcript_30997:905-1657(-)
MSSVGKGAEMGREGEGRGAEGNAACYRCTDLWVRSLHSPQRRAQRGKEGGGVFHAEGCSAVSVLRARRMKVCEERRRAVGSLPLLADHTAERLDELPHVGLHAAVGNDRAHAPADALDVLEGLREGEDGVIEGLHVVLCEDLPLQLLDVGGCLARRGREALHVLHHVALVHLVEERCHRLGERHGPVEERLRLLHQLGGGLGGVKHRVHALLVHLPGQLGAHVDEVVEGDAWDSLHAALVAEDGALLLAL